MSLLLHNGHWHGHEREHRLDFGLHRLDDIIG